MAIRSGFGKVLLVAILLAALQSSEALAGGRRQHKNAYAAMIYMGTPRDYEFYVAARVMLRSLSMLGTDADLIVIASADVPAPWIRTLHKDGFVVVSVEDVDNPYRNQANFNVRFRLSLNKLYAWSLIDYDRVVMLDSDNLFIRNTDELFRCGEFCAVFINPCIFHTGLFVLQPSLEVFKDMLHELEIGRTNPDGADQGFIVSYFADLLESPVFLPPPNDTVLSGHYRLPFGYQMDASYYYLKLRWSTSCGRNSVITFPSAPWLKPWYWWAWPVLPLGLLWHQQRWQTIGYGSEAPMVLIQSAAYLAIIVIAHLTLPNGPKFRRRQLDRNAPLLDGALKMVVIWVIIAAYFVPFFLVPRTIHPVLGWSLYLFGSLALAMTAVTALMLPVFPVLTPWVGIVGALAAMAYPWYSDGVVRSMVIFGYACFWAPIVWTSMQKVVTDLQLSPRKDALSPRIAESQLLPGFGKIC